MQHAFAKRATAHAWPASSFVGKTVLPMGPLRFEPYLRPMVWGGRRLGELLGKLLPTLEPYGESWDVSDHASHATRIQEGPMAGQSLRDLMTHHRRELLGSAASRFSVFPWLVKHLDAHDWLSVQVHPDDAKVKTWWPGEGGKTEVWFVLDALPGSKVYAGLLPGVDEKALRAAIAAGTAAECLHSFEPRPGDAVFLPAGTVHAVGGGVLMAEVQQTSDATFRLFDWNRKDAHGKSRALHVEEGLACIDWRQGPVAPVHAEAFSDVTPGQQVLASCSYFHLAFRRDCDGFSLGGQGKLQLWIPVSGAGVLHTPHGPARLTPGQVWVLPAVMPALRCQPEPKLAGLVCTLPD